MKNSKTIGCIYLMTLFVFSSVIVYAQPQKKVSKSEKSSTKKLVIDDMSVDQIFELTLEDLLNMDIQIASKSSEKISDAPGVVSVITKDDLERFGGTTLKDILERVPSLISSTVYMTDRTTIAARGDQVQPSSSHVLLLLNGRPVREALEGGIKSEMYEAFPVSLIERIEVIRGPGSVLYGSNAFSAVINVITEKAVESGFSASGLMGTPGAYGGSLKGTINSGAFNIVAGGRYLKKAEWQTDWSYPDPFQSAGYSTVSVKIPDESLGGYLEMNYNNFRFMTSYTQWEHYYCIGDYAFIFPAYGNANWKKALVDLGYSFNAADDWNMDFNITYTRSAFKTQSWPNTNRDSYELVGEWSNSYNPIDKLGIVFGGLFNYFEGEEWGPGETERVIFTDANRKSVGAYAQLNYKLLSNLNIIGGLQANKVEDIDLNIVPRAGIIWYPIVKINVKAFYSQAFRAPSINEFSINFPQMVGNPNLTPEKVNTFDVGVRYETSQMHLGLNFFHSKMENIIFQNRDTTMVPTPMYWNGGEIQFNGVELEGKYYLNKEWYVTGSMLYQTNKDQDGNENVTPISNLGTKCGLSYQSDKLTLSLFNIYQGKLDQEKFGSALNPTPNDYFLINFYGKYNLGNTLNLKSNNRLSLFVQADNILNKEIWLTDWGLAPNKSMPVNQGATVLAGLNFAIK